MRLECASLRVKRLTTTDIDFREYLVHARSFSNHESQFVGTVAVWAEIGCGSVIRGEWA